MTLLRRLSVILVILMTVFTGFGLIIPVLPVVIERTQAAPINLGLMLAVYSVMAFALSPWWGHLSDRIGRKPVLIVGLLGFSISFILFGLVIHILWLMYLTRILAGGFSGAVTSSAMAYVADVTDDEHRTSGMALAGMAIGLGFIIGPAVGGLLAPLGLRVPFLAAGGVALVNALWGWATLPHVAVPASASSGLADRPSRWAAFAGPVKYLFLVGFVGQFTITSLEGTLQYFEIAKIGATPQNIGAMLFISGVAGILVQGILVRRYVTQGREMPALILGLMASGIGLLLILLSRNFWTATAYLTVFGGGNAVLRPTLQSLITRQSVVARGLTTGLMSSFDSLARITGPVLATLLFQVAHPLPFILASGVAFGALGLICAYRNHTVPRTRGKDTEPLAD